MALASTCDRAGDLNKAASAYAKQYAAIVSVQTQPGLPERLPSGREPASVGTAAGGGRHAVKLAYIQEQGMARLPATGILHIAMSEVLVERNELEAAEAHLSRGIDLGKEAVASMP